MLRWTKDPTFATIFERDLRHFITKMLLRSTNRILFQGESLSKFFAKKSLGLLYFFKTSSVWRITCWWFSNPLSFREGLNHTLESDLQDENPMSSIALRAFTNNQVQCVCLRMDREPLLIISLHSEFQTLDHKQHSVSQKRVLGDKNFECHMHR